MRKKLCVICKEREIVEGGIIMCPVCGKGYDKQRDTDETIGALIIWVANRARRFERKHCTTFTWTLGGGA